MLFLNQQLTQWLIIIGAIFFFVIPFILNKKVKVPEGTKLPEKCHSCMINSCMVKNELNEYEQTEVSKDISVKLRQEIAKCEVNDEKE